MWSAVGRVFDVDLCYDECYFRGWWVDCFDFVFQKFCCVEDKMKAAKVLRSPSRVNGGYFLVQGWISWTRHIRGGADCVCLFWCE